MRRDVTALFQIYRECARHIRNTYFSTLVTEDWDTVENFDCLDKEIFKRMVLYRLENSYSSRLEKAVETDKILITPNSLFMPVMISRKDNSGYWDHPLKELEPGFATIAFRCYFDWNQHDLIDLRYYKGVILESNRYPEIIGHDVLIETIYGKLEYEDDIPNPN